MTNKEDNLMIRSYDRYPSQYHVEINVIPAIRTLILDHQIMKCKMKDLINEENTKFTKTRPQKLMRIIIHRH